MHRPASTDGAAPPPPAGRWDRLLLLVATLFTALMAGFFFAWSASVVPGLVAASDPAAMEVMQRVNLLVRNPTFGLVFFGAALLCLAVAVRAAMGRLPRLALLPALVYLGGGFAVTFLFNVPLNDALAPLDPAGPGAPAQMRGYLAAWGPWNDLRSVASALALLGFLPLLAAQPFTRSGA